MKDCCSFFFLLVWIGLTFSCQEIPEEKNPVILLENARLRIQIEKNGGAISSLLVDSIKLNPLSWKLDSQEMPENNKKGAPFKGHFLCLGRWGAPTPGEIQAGIPYNGEAGNKSWQVLEHSSKKLMMQVTAEKDEMEVTREVILDENLPVFGVSERVRNTGNLCRFHNMVQHVTLGIPFLDSTLLISCNAGPGFFQDHSWPSPHRWEYSWPVAKDSMGATIGLNTSLAKSSYVSTHLIQDSVGWVLAWNSGQKLLIGYVWKTSEYPWINIWHDVKEGHLHAKGLEFGTTGIGRSYQDLTRANTSFHGHNSFVLLDAGEVQVRHYMGFLFPLKDEKVESAKIEWTQDKIFLILNESVQWSEMPVLF